MTKTTNATDAIPGLVQQLFGIVEQLEQLFPRRHFTLDGHLVGSIGEVLAAERYGLTLLRMNEKKHDAKANDGTLVQIKTTQANSVGLRSKPDHLLVLQLDEHGGIDEVYNGPGVRAWKAVGAEQANGQRAIGVAKLRSLMKGLPAHARLRTIART